MKSKRIIFLGGVGDSNVFGGEPTKNKELLKRLNEMNYKVSVIDTYNSSGNVLRLLWIALRLFYYILFNPRAIFLFSTSFGNTYLIYKLLYYYPIKLNLINWVIGGNLADKIADGTYKKKYLKRISKFMVEGQKMKDDLMNQGFDNAIVTPNFKSVGDLPPINKFDDGKTHFLFLSRIMPEKGCREIMASIHQLNKIGMMDRFVVDFYGSVEEDYKLEFDNSICELQNANYCGKINLQVADGYKTLSKYHYMLFPTWWIGEGFPGVVIDAYKAGVPIIASDWNLNTEYIRHGVTGLICLPKNINNLAEVMKNAIDGLYNNHVLSKNCQKEVWNYDTKNVLTHNLMECISNSRSTY